jgi:outer membrane protein OmpA-like peptidoglycan-associated protein
MFVARFSTVFCFLSIAVSVFAGSFSNRDINDWAKKIAERRQKVTSIDAIYALSASHAWLDCARYEFDHGSNSLADIGWQQSHNIIKIVDDNKLPLKTIEAANSNLRIKDDLWLFADESKKSPRYNIVVEDVARLEVTLAWAGLKTWESGWKSATSLINDAQKKADDIKKILKSTDKPIVIPPTQPIVAQTPPSSAINIRQPVVLVVPADVTFELTSRNGTPAFPGNALIVGDNADKFKITNDAPGKFPIGSTTVTWKAIDHNNKTLTSIQKVTVVDTTPPTIQIPADINVELTTTNGMEINPGTALAIDIGDPNPNLTNNAPKLFLPGTTIITWTAKDNSGNIATAGQKVILADTLPPQIVAPDDVTVEATDPSGTIINIGPAKATDNLDPIPSVTTDAPENFPLGITIVHWTATDKYGNKSRVNQKVTVTDTTKPDFTAPLDIVIDAVSSEGVNAKELNIELPKVRDNADANPIITNDAPVIFPLGETIITWNAKDAIGNISSVKQKISVIDKKPPVLLAPDDISIEAISPTGTVVNLGNPVVSDNIDKEPTIKNDAPTSFKPGSYIITWTAIDKVGNQTKALQKVTITDITPPRLLPPPDITIEATSHTNMKINIGNPEVADNADNSPKVANDSPVLFPLGTTIVTWLSIDSLGNRSMATQRVRIVDTTPPSIIPPKDLITYEEAVKGTVVILGKPIIHDAFDPKPKVSNNAPQLFKTGKHEVIWIAVDSSGNSSVAIQKVEVLKKFKKDINLPSPNNKLPIPVVDNTKSKSVFLPYSVHFAPNSVNLSSKSLTVLKSMIPTLNKNTDIKIMIVGCADSSGDLSKNIEISMDRANVVADFLITSGIQVERITVDGKIVQTDKSAIAGAHAREARLFYSSPTIKINVVDQTTDLIVIKKTNIQEPLIKKVIKPAVGSNNSNHQKNKTIKKVKPTEKKKPISVIIKKKKITNIKKPSYKKKPVGNFA